MYISIFINRVLPYYTKLTMLSTLYCFVVKDKLIAKKVP